MTKFKAGQKWRTWGGNIRTIEAINADGVLLDDKTHRYIDGSYYDDETDDEDLVTLIEDAPEDDLHPCLERKLVVKEGVYGKFRVWQGPSGRVYVTPKNTLISIEPEDFAEAAALFAALTIATEGVD